MLLPSQVVASLSRDSLLSRLVRQSSSLADDIPSPNILAAAMDALPTTAKELLVSEFLEEKEETLRDKLEENPQQEMAVTFASFNKSFCLIGAAGTGKTTTLRKIVRDLINSPEQLGTHLFKKTGTSIRANSLGIAIVAFTTTAVNVLRKALFIDLILANQLDMNITTIHNLLEFAPVDGVGEESWRFEPRRTASNKLSIKCLVIDEASMVSLELWGQLYAALPEDVQVIMLGDINQVPPVFGDSILCYALTKLPVIELLKVYRQALDSPIIANAHKVLRGDVEEFTFDFLSLGKSANKASQYRYSLLIADKLERLMNEDKYSPEKDMLLSPWNKHDLGTININYLVAQFLTAKRETSTHEIIIGVRKIYLSEGDKVLIRKQPGIIMKIVPNYKYAGPAPKLASTNLTRWGFYKAGIDGIEGMADIDMDSLELGILGKEALEQGLEEEKEGENEEETLFRSSSHILKILLEDGTEKILREVGDFSPNIFQLGYCLTIHKSQGGEWPRVFVLTHKAHRQSLNRELLYTAITRAQKELFLIGDLETVKAATKIQKVKGNTLKEKIAWFSSGIKPLESIRFDKLAGQIEDI